MHQDFRSIGAQCTVQGGIVGSLTCIFIIYKKEDIIEHKIIGFFEKYRA